VFTVVAFVATTLLNLIGVQVAARVGRAVLAAEIVVLGIFIVSAVVVLVQHGAVRPLASPFVGVAASGAANAGAVSAVGGAILIAVLSFLGFDAIASFAEESAGDVRQVGRAIVLCLTIAGAVFIVQTYLIGVLSPMSPSELAANPAQQGTNFYDVTRVAIGAWLATVLALTKAIGPAFSAMTGQAAAARLLFGMAREGRLPKSLAAVDAKHGVPRTALATVALLTLACAVWAARRDDGLSVLVSIVDIGALVAFVLLHASVVGYFVMRRRAASTVWHVALPVIGAAVSCWVLIEASRLAQLVGVIWFVLGGLAFALAGKRVRRA